MSTPTAPSAFPWRVRTPTIIRAMGAPYVDAFFKTGALRISSFEAFRTHPNELRRDEHEGMATMEIHAPQSRLSAVAINGQEAYVLCASLHEPVLAPGEQGLVIDDTVAFAAAIAGVLPGAIGGTEGPCVYRDDTRYTATDNHAFTPPQDGEDLDAWADRHERVLGRHMQNALFIKHARYAHEREYRMIWFCSGTRQPYIDILCPQAVAFCRRLHGPA
ncbi:hypothetical protein [Stenotrophomonas sp. 24(2023)]|uniref:hypothetical protein n=1 Tax=Stenotrophomonas sp. 24(2023) TaxID=3068324 RepID=UPI0027DF2F92|nr:hypothetical protein [Stenotrophomonas sp. 24(2023)]WMJ69215.1 hypothetical protein Q9R17_18895 [Stenotrophomonas sp. 24(2023)]